MVYQPIIDHRQGVGFGYEALSRLCVMGTWIPRETWFGAAATCGQAAEADLVALTTAVAYLRQLPQRLWIGRNRC
ncbi:MAG: EAL domain-containing protein [Alicyclobacillaceae bacterium]|nr:EAL domain-containing protein [Alicyclobacillaceae bacterium]